MKKKIVFKIIKLTTIGIITLCLILLTALYIISGGFMKQTYMEPWSKSYSEKYSDPRMQLIACGLLAANNHNMQPWTIRFDESDANVFYLYADSSRLTKEIDPYARQMMITQGTFLEYIVVAGERKGWNVEISLFPDGTYDEANLVKSMDEKPVAKVTLSETKVKSDLLYDAMFLPDTNRNPYKPDKLTKEQSSSIESLSSENDVSIKLYQDQDNLDKIGEYVLQSATIEAGVTRVMDESSVIFRANEYQKNKYRYGYSVEGQGTTGFMKNILQGMLTIVPSLNTGKSAEANFINATKTYVDNTPAYAMIITSGNSRIEQVESGMLYSKLVLTGHTMGLVMQPISQVLEEYEEMKLPYTEFKQIYAPNQGTVQMLFRLGVPTKEVPLSMRRDVESLIEDER